MVVIEVDEKQETKRVWSRFDFNVLNWGAFPVTGGKLLVVGSPKALGDGMAGDQPRSEGCETGRT